VNLLARNPRRVRIAGVALSASALIALAACSWLTGVNEPDELGLDLDADTDQLTLVTSTYFIMVPNPECPEDCPRIVQLVVADTTVISTPYQRIYPFTSRQQYFLEAWPTDGDSATVDMRVTIDGETWYDDFRLLVPVEDGDRETIRFVYNFRELVI
jgi:hypothetical protein